MRSFIICLTPQAHIRYAEILVFYVTSPSLQLLSVNDIHNGTLITATCPLILLHLGTPLHRRDQETWAFERGVPGEV